MIIQFIFKNKKQFLSIEETKTFKDLKSQITSILSCNNITIKYKSPPTILHCDDSTPLSKLNLQSSPLTIEEISTTNVKVIKRHIPSNNSCLFGAIYYCQTKHRSEAGARDLRLKCAEEIRLHPDEYNAGILERPIDEYVQWILKDTSWGGSIELKVLSHTEKIEIATVDIRTQVMHVFGQEEGLDARIYLLYDGKHYDSLALNDSEHSPEIGDRTIFCPTDDSTCALMQSFARGLWEKGQFTDLHKFSLRCADCDKLLTGEKEAMEHARLTAHVSFSEVNKPR